MTGLTHFKSKSIVYELYLMPPKIDRIKWEAAEARAAAYFSHLYLALTWRNALQMCHTIPVAGMAGCYTAKMPASAQ